MLTVLIYLVETWRGHLRIEWRSPFLIPAVLFVIAGAISVVTAPSLTAALGLYRAYVLEPIAFALVLANVLRNEQRAFLIVAGLMLSATVAGLANSFTVLSGLLQGTYDVTATPPVVIYLTANAVALYVVPITGLAGAYALHGHLPERAAGATFFVIGVIVTALSFSRGGYLALAAVVAVLALSHRRRWFMLGAAAVLLAALALVPPIRHRILIETQNVYGNTVQSRIDLWNGAIKLIEHRPLFGAGLSGFQERVQPYLTNFHSTAQFIDPHNIVLNFYVELGLLGLVAAAWVIGLGFITSWRGWRSAPLQWRPLHLGVLLALVAVVVHGMVDVPYFKNDLSLLFWTLLGLTYAGTRWSAASKPS